MKTESVPLDELVPDPANLRQHPERNRQAAHASLRRFGAARSIVVDAKGIVRAGNATLEAARAAGIDKAIVVDADGDELIVVRRKDWSDTEATAYSIADNRVNDLSTFDDAALSETLRALQSEDFPIEAAGFTDAEVDALIGRLGDGRLEGDEVEDPEGEWEGMPEFDQPDDNPFKSIVVHFHTAADMQEFARLVGQTITEDTKSISFPKQPRRMDARSASYVEG
jgi:ParB-like chromosome segregation protein Spo0J